VRLPIRFGWGLAVGTVAAGSLLAACADVAPPRNDSNIASAPTALVPLPSDAEVMLRVPSLEEGIVQVGKADVSIGTATLDRGTITLTAGWDGEPAIDLPDFTKAANYPRAALVVTNAGDGPDQMNPGEKDFSWGADFWLDADSLGSAVDNGDNLIQRGIWTYPNYFKAEVDEGHPACAVHGDDDYVFVRGYEELKPETWYRLTCTRREDEVTIVFSEISPNGGGRPILHSAAGHTGSVTFADRSTPLLIGGKVGADGQLLAGATDQFNGVVMNPFFMIHE